MNRTMGRRISSFRATLAGLLTVFALATGCQTPKGPLEVPMLYRPTDTQTVGASDVNASLFVAPVTDDRDIKDAIGQNIEEAAPLRIFTNDNPTVFMQNAVRDELRKGGVTIADTAASADRTLTLSLTRFYVEEKDTYKAEVRTTATVTDKSGAQLWKGVVVGENSRFGRSLSRENYQEGLSDATQKMVGRLLGTDGFLKAMKK